MMIQTSPAARLAVGCSIGLALFTALGCSKADSYGAYERELEMREKSRTAAQGAGAKMTEKTYPGFGKAWAVDLSGQQLAPETFDNVARAGHISELNLSKTNLTDADMKRVSGLVGVCTHVDLSHTEITDTGLGELRNLLFLSQLNLEGTKCTPAGVDAFKKRLLENPNVRSKNPRIKLK